MRSAPALAAAFLAAAFLARAERAAPASTGDTAADTAESDPASGPVRGVNPADNLTKLELIPRFSRIDDRNDVSAGALTLKYDRAIRGAYGVNVELPLAWSESPRSEHLGNGDLNVRFRVQFGHRRWTFITGLESVFPIASHDTLGSGKFQLNPTVAAVYAFSPGTFAAVTAKHVFSVAGDGGRDDIVQAQFRILAAHTTPSGWWFLADPQLWMDYRNGARMQLGLEGEAGRMLGRTVGVWIRGGGRIAGEWHREDWTAGGGVRFLFF